METNELQELLDMTKAIKSKIRSSKNWDENGLSAVLIRHLSKFDTDIEWYEQERDIIETEAKTFPVLSSYRSDREYNSSYDPGLTESETNQPSYA